MVFFYLDLWSKKMEDTRIKIIKTKVEVHLMEPRKKLVWFFVDTIIIILSGFPFISQTQFSFMTCVNHPTYLYNLERLQQRKEFCSNIHTNIFIRLLCNCTCYFTQNSSSSFYCCCYVVGMKRKRIMIWWRRWDDEIILARPWTLAL